jgi:hypothetical protein
VEDTATRLQSGVDIAKDLGHIEDVFHASRVDDSIESVTKF